MSFVLARQEFSDQITLVALLVTGKAFIQGVCSALWIHAPELLPTKMRATGHSSSVIVSRMGQIAASFWIDSFTVAYPLVGGIIFAIANSCGHSSVYLERDHRYEVRC